MKPHTLPLFMPFASVALSASLSGCAGKTIDVGTAANSHASAVSAAAATPDAAPNTVSLNLAGKAFQLACKSTPPAPDGGWAGPYLDTNDCTSADPSLQMRVTVMFTGFLPSEGFAPGVYDLADRHDIVVMFDVDRPKQEVPIGQQIPFANYASAGPIESIYSNPPQATLAPAARGTVIVTKLQGGTAPPLDGPWTYDITLKDVVVVAGTKNGDFPDTVSISEARLASAAP